MSGTERHTDEARRDATAKRRATRGTPRQRRATPRP